MDVIGFLREIASDRRYARQIVHVRMLEAAPARYAKPRTELPQALWSLLRKSGIFQLYTHQAAAIDSLAEGKDVAVVTGTASGKTLCYNIPVVTRLLEEPDARALYLFPTKALTQDQLAALQRWGQDGALKDRLRPAVYDGDTPSHNRSRIRSDSSIILTNPDMLHVGILPYHGRWHAMLRNLRYLVIDELHAYRGIFGSHVACVLRRLRRLCDHYGSRPQIVCCSATIANPLELAEKLTARRMTLVDDDGSPRGRKYFVLWNPPFLDMDNMLRRSANVEAMELLRELVRRRTQTIVFAKSRVAAELIYKYAAEGLRGEGDLAQRIRPYRGGYLPEQRRAIEKELFSGRLLAVSATNALELGIDIGKLDAAILVGFPGTICSTWQQAGRAGRSSQDSLVVLVGYNEPVDQYLMRNPEYLFGAGCEHGVVDPQNPYILASQLACACFEKPLEAADSDYFGPLVEQVAGICCDEGQMKSIDGRYYWSTTEFPAKATSLRTISPDTYAIADVSQNKVIAQVDSISAPELVYPNAIYLHEGQSYLVKELDSQAKVAKVAPVEVDYYTQPVLASSCRLGEAAETKEWPPSVASKPGLSAAWRPRRDQMRRAASLPGLGDLNASAGRLAFGPCDVTWQTIAFRKIKYYTMELIGQDRLDLPSQTLSTTACWWAVGEKLRDAVSEAGFNPIEAMAGLRNLLLSSLPALAMCDRRDISGMVDSSNLGVPTIIVYDRYSGGLGFAQKGYELIDTWLEMSRQIVRGCPCQLGCPSCVGLANLRPPVHHDPDVYGGYPVPNKQATLILLNAIQA
jgi:DEAD/DEAH box helicase domain-containing protein